MSMGRSWAAVKADKHARDRVDGRDVDAAQARAREVTSAYILGHRLGQLRAETGMGQAELAARMGVSQPRVSQLEQGELGQMELDTIRRYVAALGGRLRVVADFDDHDVTVSANQIDREETYA